MNRIQILQEMGITSWVSKCPDTSIPQNKSVVSSSGEQGSEDLPIQKKEIPVSNQSDSDSSIQKEDFVHEVDLAKALEMRWVLVFDGSPEINHLFSKITRSIEDLGAKCQIFDLSLGAMTAKDIQGDIVLAFGQKAGVLLSGERDTIENLREIVFEVQNREGMDIPLVVTHHPKDLLKQPHLKAFVWDDILWARSIWLESRF